MIGYNKGLIFYLRKQDTDYGFVYHYYRLGGGLKLRANSK